MAADRPGNIVVLSGRNRAKIDYILAALEAGLHVLADKPWIIRSRRPAASWKRRSTRADAKGLIAYDIMTERFEITRCCSANWSTTPRFSARRAGSEQSRPSTWRASITS